MNNDRIIKYENVRNEKYQIVNFHKNGTIEHLLINEFETAAGKDYIVVGKLTSSIPAITKEGTGWTQIVDNVVSRYKTQADSLRKKNDDSYSEVANIPNFFLTKEGYDLITHKFLFTNKEIIRTVCADQKGYNCFDNEFENFRSLDFYEKVYTLRDYEFQNLDISNLMEYTNANFNKCKRVIELAVREGVLPMDVVQEFFSSSDNFQILNSIVMTIEAINTIREKNKNKGNMKK